MSTTDNQAAGWYYADGGKQSGPVGLDELAALARAGRIRGDTLVWCEGMAGWKPYGEAAAAGATPAPMSAMPAADGSAPCSLCGRPFPAAELIPFENALVCADCKPAFVQRLKENADLPQAMAFGGFWIRFGATFIDGIIMSVVQYAVYIPVMFATMGGLASAAKSDGPPLAMLGLQIGMIFFSLIVGAAYEIWMVGRFGATLGKMACRLKVVTAEGGRVSYARATGRHFAKIVSQMILYIGFIIAGFDREKKALHDMMCNTRVIRV